MIQTELARSTQYGAIVIPEIDTEKYLLLREEDILGIIE